MRVTIDLPAKRSLTPNEQRVYKLLQEGLEPLEVARRLHMALKISNLANRHDVPPDTVMGLMASIREKGWEIPNKEENNMAKGQKTPEEKIHEISVLRDEGKSQNKIAEITGVPLSTVGKICARIGKAETKEEPAPSANDTSSKRVNEKNIFTNSIVPEIPADVNPCDEISDENFCCEVTGDTDMEAYTADRERISTREAIPEAVVEACIEKRNTLLGELEDIKEQIREIEEFLGIDREGRECL